LNYNQYLRKYEDEYKVRRNSDGHYEIIGKNGTISVHSLECDVLSYTYVDSGENTPRMLSYAIKKIKNSGLFYDLAVLCDREFIIHIKETDVPKWVDILRIYKKRKYPPEYRKILSARLHKARRAKKCNNG
jgi:hypothetical protein